MAFKKIVRLPSEAVGTHIRVGYHAIDIIRREATAHLFLYTAATTPKHLPLCQIAKVRLMGAKFDEYLSNAVLDAPGATVVRQLYRAAKAEPLLPGEGLTVAQLTLADAEDA